jgi:general secretion pathway protein L
MNNSSAAIFSSIEEVLSQWIDSVVEFAAGHLSRFGSPRTVRLIEEESGEFGVQSDQRGTTDQSISRRVHIAGGHTDDGLATIVASNHVELVLRPNRFIFRELELPKRATDFMPGVVRSQIDRLTPWSATDAAFGWGVPMEADDDKMAVTLAATTIALIEPYVQAIVEIGAHSVSIFAYPPGDPEAQSIKVWEQPCRAIKGLARIRRALVAALAAVVVTAGVALGAKAIVSMSLAAQQDEIAHKIAQTRRAMGAALGSTPLEQRKHDAVSSVLVLEWLSSILPNQTYVTELRLEGNKVRLSGITHDAPSLIGLIEQSGRFTRASFFAPTTRASPDTADRFHIEAIVKPVGPST